MKDSYPYCHRPYGNVPPPPPPKEDVKNYIGVLECGVPSGKTIAVWAVLGAFLCLVAIFS